jgi:hypothetical protein
MVIIREELMAEEVAVIVVLQVLVMVDMIAVAGLAKIVVEAVVTIDLVSEEVEEETGVEVAAAVVVPVRNSGSDVAAVALVMNVEVAVVAAVTEEIGGVDEIASTRVDMKCA